MGLVYSAISQNFPPRSKFSVDDIPDLSGKVILITGGNVGIGFETAKACLSHNAKVYLACRNPEKTQKAIDKLRDLTGKEALFHQLDLADLKAVKRSGEEFLNKEKELHVLYNNAGVMMCPIDQTTVDGYDMQVGTNVLGHFYFTKLLLPALLAGAKSSPDKKARVVTLSSFAHELASTLRYETFEEGPVRRKTYSNTMYSQSKLGNAVFAAELARRYGDEGIVSIGLHPGNIESDLQRHMGWFEYYVILKATLFPAAQGALTSLYAGTSEAGADLNGKYLIPWARLGQATKAAQDPKNGKELWDWLEKQLTDKHLS